MSLVEVCQVPLGHSCLSSLEDVTDQTKIVLKTILTSNKSSSIFHTQQATVGMYCYRAGRVRGSPCHCTVQEQNSQISSMGVSSNGGTSKSFIFIGLSIINHPAIGNSPFIKTMDPWWPMMTQSPLDPMETLCRTEPFPGHSDELQKATKHEARAADLSGRKHGLPDPRGKVLGDLWGLTIQDIPTMIFTM